MTAVAPVSAIRHRPPDLPSATTTFSPVFTRKRPACAISSDSVGHLTLDQPGEGSHVHKKQNTNVGESITSIPPPPKFSKFQDDDEFPLEFSDGFFLGPATTQTTSTQVPFGDSLSPPTLPLRPWHRGSRGKKTNSGGLNNTGIRKRTDTDMSGDSHSTGPPHDAPRLIAGKTAGFGPWLGFQAEDVLNEHNVKNGFTDKSHTSHNETISARQSLYGVLKHKSILHALSALFDSVAEERQTHNKISSSSSFKPPPRVTLTEAKRKSWLAHLADPEVPLRKLSRTIPQGIRGQGLLEQCFDNRVPVERALWFVKCVGANEIRSLKRKGTSATFVAGSDMKWLREWTTNVEQFLDGSIDRWGQPDWRPMLNYALNFTVRLYSESLLNRDHYLDWITRMAAAATLDYLPVWLLMVNLHHAELVRHRKRGSQLAKCLLDKLYTIDNLDRDIWAPLVQRLRQTLRRLMVSNPAAFVMPQTWSKSPGIMADCLGLDSPLNAQVAFQISFRNQRMSSPSIFRPLNTPSKSMRALFNVLDTAVAPFRIEELSQDCRSACHDAGLLVRSVLDWCTSPYRTGTYTLYLGVRLLTLWRNEKDIDMAVITFLASQHNSLTCDADCLGQLISHLVRTGILSLGKYLQWLIARGGLERAFPSISGASGSPARAGLDPVEILTAIPLSTVSPTVKNLRCILLGRSGFALNDEIVLISTCKDHLSSQLPNLFHFFQARLPEPISSVPDMSKLSCSVKFEIGRFIQDRIGVLRASKNETTKNEVGDVPPNPCLIDADFCALRGFLEILDELVVLADLIDLATVSDDDNLLASAADTVTSHFEAFSALGVFDKLHLHLFRAYISMRASSRLPRRFTLSLISLASRVSSSLASTSSLQQDLARGDQSEFATAACSPVSDGMAESLQQAGTSFVEEFEAVLCSGNRMEEQTMAQLFHVLSERLGKTQHQDQGEEEMILFALLARLRIYRIRQFDTLIRAWLEGLVAKEESMLGRLIPMLISTGCASFGLCVDLLLEASSEKTKGNSAASFPRSLTAIFLAKLKDAETAADPDSYRLKLERARHIEQHPIRSIDLHIKAGLGQEETWVQKSRDPLLIHLVLKGQGLGTLPHTLAAQTISSKLDELLQLPDHATDLSFSELVSKTNDLSLPFCLLRLQLWDAETCNSSITTEREAIAVALFELAQDPSDERWLSFMTAICHKTACQLREKAEVAFFSLPLFQGGGSESSSSSIPAALIQAGEYMKILSQIEQRAPCAGGQELAEMLVERFAAVMRSLVTDKSLANGDLDTAKVSSSREHDEATLDQTIDYIGHLLHMTTLCKAAFLLPQPDPLSSPTASNNKSTISSTPEVVRLLFFMTNIALHPLVEAHPTTISSHVIDVAAIIVDDISEDVRLTCGRILRGKNTMHHDRRVEYLFGSANHAKGVVVAPVLASLGPHSLSSSSATMAEVALQLASKDGKKIGGGEFSIRNWEMLDGGAGAGAGVDTSSVSLSLFGARREV